MNLRPSNAARWMNCPGSVSAEDQLPEVVTDAAMEGTAAHWVAEQILKDEAPLVGALAPNGWEVDQEMIECGHEYARYIHSLASPMSQLAVEMNLRLDRIWPGMTGTADAVLFDGDETIHVIDYKYGWDIVDERNNPQLNCYGIGAIDTVDVGGLPPNTKVVQTIVQPRPWCNRGPIRSHTITAAMLLLIAHQYNELARIALSDNPIRSSGPHCKHCLAAATCPALIGASYNAIDFAVHSNGMEPTVDDMALIIRQIRNGKKRIDNLLDVLESTALQKIENGEAVPGYTIGSGRPSKKWNVPDQQIINLGIALDVDLQKPAAITPIQAAKIVDDEMIKPYVTNHPGPAKLVELDDHIATLAFSKTNTE